MVSVTNGTQKGARHHVHLLKCPRITRIKDSAYGARHCFMVPGTVFFALLIANQCLQVKDFNHRGHGVSRSKFDDSCTKTPCFSVILRGLLFLTC